MSPRTRLRKARGRRKTSEPQLTGDESSKIPWVVFLWGYDNYP